MLSVFVSPQVKMIQGSFVLDPYIIKNSITQFSPLLPCHGARKITPLVYTQVHRPSSVYFSFTGPCNKQSFFIKAGPNKYR